MGTAAWSSVVGMKKAEAKPELLGIRQLRGVWQAGGLLPSRGAVAARKRGAAVPGAQVSGLTYQLDSHSFWGSHLRPQQNSALHGKLLELFENNWSWYGPRLAISASLKSLLEMQGKHLSPHFKPVNQFAHSTQRSTSLNLSSQPLCFLLMNRETLVRTLGDYLSAVCLMCVSSCNELLSVMGVMRQTRTFSLFWYKKD